MNDESNTPKYKLQLMLCGYFSTAVSADKDINLDSAKWRPRIVTDDELAEVKRFYYPEFVDFCLISSRQLCYAGQGFQTTLDFRGREIPYNVEEMRLVIYPNDIAMAVIKVCCESSDLNDLTALGSSLRDPYGMTARNDHFAQEALRPLIEAARTLNPGLPDDPNILVELGNKFKAFQIIDGCDNTDTALTDSLLFDLGTMSPVCMDKSAKTHSADYEERIIRESKLSYFTNWTALALFDTFTMLTFDVPDWRKAMWLTDYFYMIYLYGVYRKIFLQRLNLNFRKDHNHASQLTKQYETFETESSFHHISYNFLPNEVNIHIFNALEIDREKEQVYHTLLNESRRQEEINDKKVNNMLTFLTLITIISVVWDGACLLERLLGFGDTAFVNEGFWASTAFLLGIVILGILLIMRRK